MRTQEEWLALCLRSESDRPNEWLCVANVIRNRVRNRRWPDTYRGVIRQPRQFSAFNATRDLDNDAAFDATMQTYAGDREGWHGNDYDRALEFAAWFIDTEWWEMPLSHATFHYWSPVGMPDHGRPPWDFSQLRCFAAPGVDPFRFVFAEDVSPSHPEANNSHLFDYSRPRESRSA